MDELSQGQLVCGRFTLHERLGAGGHAEIWRAHDEDQQRDVALKILFPTVAALPGAFANLAREHAIWRRLSHPRFLEIYPPVKDAKATALPMAIAVGGDLRRLRGASYTEIVPLLIELAEALAHAHAKAVVHRDLKPGNVLLDGEGHVKLTDFGVAGVDGEAASRTVGSPFSASPQQLAGEPPQAADDLYGFGTLAYELLSGYPPFYPQFSPQRVASEAPAELRPRHDCPQRLRELVMRMLAKQPGERPRSMTEVIGVLQASLSDALTYTFEEEIDAAGDPERAGRPSAAAVSAPAVAPAPGAAKPVAAAAAPRAAARVHPPDAERIDARGPSVLESRDWTDIRADLPRITVTDPRIGRLQPMQPRRWPYVLVMVLLLGAAAAFVALPHFAPGRPPAPPLSGAAPPKAPASVAPASAAPPGPAQGAAPERLASLRMNFEQRLAELDGRAASVWGGASFAAAKRASVEALAAFDSGDLVTAENSWNAGVRALAQVAAGAPAALAEQLATGNRALEAGDALVASQAFSVAARIEPGDARVAQGLARAQALDGLLPLLADAANAESGHDPARAIELYQKVLARDPANRAARDGLARTRAVAGDDRYSRALGEGFQALSGGNLDAARSAFEEARRLRPESQEALDGLAQLSAAAAGREFGALRARAEKAESEERWSDALREYEQVLARDASLQFARSGRERVIPRVELAARLQGLIDRPDRLAAADVRAEAQRLLARAHAAMPTGPVIRSQIARLELLLPDYDKPVRLAVESDNATRVEIARIGSFGAFARREIELKPGRYTLVGRRAGFRDVRRDITVSPGQALQVVSIACQERI